MFFAFVIPGFISLKAYQLFHPASERKTADQLIDALAYSSINYALLIIPIAYIESIDLKTNHKFWYFSFYVLVFFVFPIIWAFLWSVLRKTKFFQNRLPHPTQKAWDFVFAQRKEYWVKVTLKDGTIVAGFFGEKSFASSAPAQEQIYLEETWKLNENGGFEREIDSTAGVIVLSADISHIELRDLEENINV